MLDHKNPIDQSQQPASVQPYKSVGEDHPIIDFEAEREANVAVQAVMRTASDLNGTPSKDSDAIRKNLIECAENNAHSKPDTEQYLLGTINDSFTLFKPTKSPKRESFQKAIATFSNMRVTNQRSTTVAIFRKIDVHTGSALQPTASLIVYKDGDSFSEMFNPTANINRIISENPDSSLYALVQQAQGNKGDEAVSKKEQMPKETKRDLSATHPMLVVGRYDPEAHPPRAMTEWEKNEFKRRSPVVAAITAELCEMIASCDGKTLPIGTPVNIAEGGGGYVVQLHRANTVVIYSAMELAVEIHRFLKGQRTNSGRESIDGTVSSKAPLRDDEYRARRKSLVQEKKPQPARHEAPKPQPKPRAPLNSIAVINALHAWRDNYLAADPDRQFPAGMPLNVETTQDGVFVKYHAKPDRKVESLERGYEIINHFVRTASVEPRRDAVKTEQTKEE